VYGTPKHLLSRVTQLRHQTLGRRRSPTDCNLLSVSACTACLGH